MATAEADSWKKISDGWLDQLIALLNVAPRGQCGAAATAGSEGNGEGVLPDSFSGDTGAWLSTDAKTTSTEPTPLPSGRAGPGSTWPSSRTCSFAISVAAPSPATGSTRGNYSMKTPSASPRTGAWRRPMDDGSRLRRGTGTVKLTPGRTDTGSN